jgi:hypothetical protein
LICKGFRTFIKNMAKGDVYREVFLTPIVEDNKQLTS